MVALGRRLSRRCCSFFAPGFLDGAVSWAACLRSSACLSSFVRCAVARASVTLREAFLARPVFAGASPEYDGVFCGWFGSFENIDACLLMTSDAPGGKQGMIRTGAGCRDLAAAGCRVPVEAGCHDERGRKSHKIEAGCRCTPFCTT